MRHLYAFILLLLTSYIHSFAQTDNSINFQRFSTEWAKIDKGLSQNSVFAVLQDKDDFMWFGTWDGLNKFDGYKFTIFRPQRDMPQKSISNETVRCIYQDKSGFLWLGTEEGLNKLNRYTLEFEHYKKDINNPYAITSDTINTILGDSNDLLYIGTNNGLNIFDIRTNTFFNIELFDDYSPKVFSLCFLNKIFLLLGTDRGCIKYDILTGSKIFFNRETTPQVSISDTIYEMIFDTYGFIWAATPLGLIRYNTETKEIKCYRNIPEKTNSLSENFVTSVFVDSKNNLWVATNGGGVNLYDYEYDNFKVFRHISGKDKSISNDYINAFTEDRFGNIWIATAKGINRIDNYSNLFYHYYHIQGNVNTLNNNTVWSIYENDNGEIWLGTDEGVNIYDKTTGKFSFITKKTNNPNSISSNQIRTIFKDSEGDFWIGTYDAGINRLDVNKNKFQHFNKENNINPIASNQVWSVAEDKNKNIWFGTLNGLVKYDRKKDTIINFYHNTEVPNSLCNNIIYNLYVDKKGYLWICTYNGLSRLNIDNMMFENYYHNVHNFNSLSNNRVFSVYEDKEGIFWIATMGGGLNRFDMASQTIKIYTENEGLANNIVYNILEDNLGHLWLSTNFGLSRFNKSTETFVNYDITDGIQSSEFNLGAACKLKSGELLFGGMQGFNMFEPEKFIENQMQAKTVITAFKVFNKPKQYQYKNRDTIILTYYDNFFSFEFAALDYTNPKKIKYAFKLDNFDKDWTYTDAERRYAEYTNVPPGNYIFRVKATNSQGFWAKDELNIFLNIQNVWWRTLWFKASIVFLILIILSVYIFDRYQKIRKKHLWEKQKLLFEKQVFELKQKALSLQMNPHFIFNTLNSIQTFILKNNTDQAIQFMGKLSQLMRLILTGTREVYVPLMNEIKILSHYLDLEKIRFQNKFEYSIHVDNTIDSEFIGVPPMLVQPFVENALLHGIMHKKEIGHIKITFKQTNENIVCIVEDDGVGREVAARIKRESGLGHSSRGIAITTDRLNLFEEKNIKQKRISISDIVDADGTVAGTRVDVLLPFIEL